MKILAAAICGYVLDLILGDPETLTAIHPVVLMGHCITALEKLLRQLFPKTEKGELIGGMLLAMMIPIGTLLFSSGILWLLNRIIPLLAFLAACIWCWQALAIKNLCDEAEQVQRTLENGTLSEARKAVSRIVGRDTEALDRNGVIRAAIETVAESFSDGITAPMLYMLIGGAPLALCYKSINTLDSMVGYKNERYLFFGRAGARLDDAVNYIPSRLGALLLIGSAKFCGEDSANAKRIWKRDRRRHLSPNAAQCEAAMAGALGLRLCGPASYFGEWVDKPWIGENTREAETNDIRRACRMDRVGSLLGLVLLCLLRIAVIVMVRTL